MVCDPIAEAACGKIVVKTFSNRVTVKICENQLEKVGRIILSGMS